MAQIRRPILRSLWLCGLAIALSATTASAQFDSSEPVCSTSNALFCDDFEDGAWWYSPEQPNLPENDGWLGGVFFPSDPNGTNYGRCGGASRTGGGAAGTNCTATSMFMTDTMGAGANGRFGIAGSTDFYIRYYWWVSPGYKYGHQKGLGLEKALNGSHFEYGLFHHPFQSGELQYNTQPQAGNRWLKANQGKSASMNQGGWYLFEAHIKLNTPGQSNGVLEVWLDFCANDATCPGMTAANQTLIMNHTDVNYRGTDTAPVKSFYWNNWSNYFGQGSAMTAPPSNGEMYYDQIVVSKNRIGPMGATGGPAPPPPPPPSGPVPAPTWVGN